MISKIKKVISLSLCVAMTTALLSGCGAKKEQLPELLQPEIMTDWFYAPFEYDIGNPDVFVGKVYYETYDLSFDIPVTIESILVEHGMEVKKGDKIATVDVGDSQNKLDNINALIKNENSKYEYLTKQLEKTRTNTKKMISDAKANGAEKKEIDELNAVIAVAEENYRYETVLHEKVLKDYENQAREYKILVDNSVLYSPCDGIVGNYEWRGYREFSPNWPIATIVNTGSRYITATAYDTLNATMSGKYENYIKKIIYNGVEYDATEIRYSDEEYLAANADPDNHKYTYKLTFEDIDKLEPGENVIIQFYQSLVHSEKTIMLDSVKENEGNVVYVKGANGAPEKRTVAFGERDEHYVQVLDGLNDDDLVYCSTFVPVPVGVEPVEVPIRDYISTNNTAGYYQMGGGWSTVYSEVQGIVTNLSENFAAGKKISVGDYIFSVSTGTGAAEMKETELALKRAKKAYKDTESSYDSMIKEIKGDSSEEKEAKAELVEEKKKQLELLQADIDLAEKNYKYIADKYDADGNLKVYAKDAGEIFRVKIKVDDRLESGQEVFELMGEAISSLIYVYPQAVEKPVALWLDSNDPADYGETVTIEAHGITQKFTVIGGCFDPIRRPNEFDFFIKGEDGVVPYAGGVASYNIINLQKCINIFNGKILDEKQMGYADYTYVWVERNGYPVKQYVKTKEANAGGYAPLLDKTGTDTVILYGLKSGDKIY